MPRARPHRRRRRATAASSPAPPALKRVETVPTAAQRRWTPSAGVVTATGIGIWLGLAFAGIGGTVEMIALWVGVLMAGLGGGRIFRRVLQSRSQRSR